MTRFTCLMGILAVVTGLGTHGIFASSEREIDAESVNAFLKRFHEQPRIVMNEPPERWDESGKRVDPNAEENLRFSRQAIESGRALIEKDRARARMCMNWQGKTKCLGAKPGIFSEIHGSDLPEALVDGGATTLIRTLESLEQKGLMKASLTTQPWSGDYWPHFKGLIATRYGDPGFPDQDWRTNHLYIENRPADLIARRGSDLEVNQLSPSEKYELLIGDSTYSITERMWRRGERYFEDDGVVETWLGICHGWSAAALMVARPEKTVEVPAADGRRTLRFYPSDLKALSSLLWAEGDFETRFVGGRCTRRNPTQNEIGRIVDEDCFDNNPGTWHLAVTNQIGVAKRGFILDASYDYQIWNQPVFQYRYRYFNPQTHELVGTLEEARVPMRRFTQDVFRSFRSDQAKSVVGIVMDLTYMASTAPTQSRTDSREGDRMRTVRYVYDLELNSSGEIIGGEWYANQHPDFLWIPAIATHAKSYHEDEATGSWSIEESLPESWRTAARNAAFEGLPLSKILDELMKESVN